MLTEAQKAVLWQTCNAVIETVKEADPVVGAPGGIMYLAFMEKGWNIDQFNAMMGALVMAQRLRKVGDCYFPA